MVAILKPIIYIWATMNAVDDLTILIRVFRLGTMMLPGHGKSGQCAMCDDVMGDLLRGSEGLEAIPCNWACLRVPRCVQMCEGIKRAGQNSTHYPCIAAGYCDAVDEGEVEVEGHCVTGAFFSCQPSHHCIRKRRGIKFSCELRPGIGRWVGMKNAVGQHAGALADGLLSQPHCGEPGASKYCIATPTGLGAVAEGIGHILSVVYGGWKTIASIESPGGDDDRQWLTFWLILTIILFIERYLARVVLSTVNVFGVPVYYEMKLILLIWLLFRDGAESVYRHLRRAVASTVGGRLLKKRQRAADLEELAILRRDCVEIVDKAIADEQERKRHAVLKRREQLQRLQQLQRQASRGRGGLQRQATASAAFFRAAGEAPRSFVRSLTGGFSEASASDTSTTTTTKRSSTPPGGRPRSLSHDELLASRESSSSSLLSQQQPGAPDRSGEVSPLAKLRAQSVSQTRLAPQAGGAKVAGTAIEPSTTTPSMLEDYEEEIELDEDDELSFKRRRRPSETQETVVEGIASVLLGESSELSELSDGGGNSPKGRRGNSSSGNGSTEGRPDQTGLQNLSAAVIERYLYVVSSYILTEAGSAALNRTTLNPSAKGLLVERAAARISFQPRFVTIELIGTADGAYSELPAMDTNGLLDAYVTCRLRAQVDGGDATAEKGAAYPQGGVSTRTQYRTLRPQWRQSLELPLRGGSLDADGMFRSAESAQRTELLLQVYDSDVGVWGWLLRISEMAGIGLAIACIVMYVTGQIDDLSSTHATWILGTAFTLLVLFMTSYVAYVRWGSDDESIGEACIPLGMCMDQRTHTIQVALRSPGTRVGLCPPVRQPRRNPFGTLGVIRVALSMSER